MVLVYVVMFMSCCYVYVVYVIMFMLLCLCLCCYVYVTAPPCFARGKTSAEADRRRKPADAGRPGWTLVRRA